MGQVPMSVCQRRYSVGPSSASTRYGAAIARASATQAAHPSPSSASGMSRARTSSDRLVSWVVSVVIEVGQVLTSRSHQAWNSSAVIDGWSGWPPTSLAPASRNQR